MLAYHLERLSFLLDTTTLPEDTRCQWAIEELIVIFTFLTQADSLTRCSILPLLQTLVPSYAIQGALARIAGSEEVCAGSQGRLNHDRSFPALKG